jgi:hypothetical protein
MPASPLALLALNQVKAAALLIAVDTTRTHMLMCSLPVKLLYYIITT